jgi:hypothetical protein
MITFLVIIFLDVALAASAWANYRQADEIERLTARHARPVSGRPPGDQPRTSLITPARAASHASATHEASTPYLPPAPRHAGLPRRDAGATLNRAPWETGSFAVPDVTLVPVYGEAPQDVVERLEQGLIV